VNARATFCVVAIASWLCTAGARRATATTLPADIPDIVILDQLSKIDGLYEPVPFNHKAHASMSGMKNGCITCHHRQPDATVVTANTMPASRVGASDQANAAGHPACRTCHEPRRVDLHQPGLKGAYHRQCLNCHREWAQANNCNVCHKPKGAVVADRKQPTPDDILGRMHPPMAEPVEHLFKARFTPADGGNILFRHKEHIHRYDVKCVSCHQAEDSCARCHRGSSAPLTQPEAAHPVALDRTWEQAHAQCSSCHVRRENQCTTCHYKDDQKAPVAFEHAVTGQLLDASHAGLKCVDCHTNWGPTLTTSCGTSGCHKSGPVSFPAKRPGPLIPVKSPEKPPVKPMTVPAKSNSIQVSDRGDG
jgi:hypothetical protein